MRCAVTGCGRQIVRGPLGQWAHTENPGRDHHYARPTPRSAAHSDLAGFGELRSRDEDQPPSEASGGASTSAPAALPPAAGALSLDPSSRAGGDTLRPQLEATDPPVSEGPVGVPLSLGF
jgi:hypothetical protein